MNLAQLFHLDSDTRRVAAGEAIFRAGETGDLVYVILSGTADVLVRGNVVERAETGALLGEMALIDNSPRAATVVATSDCELAQINRKRFLFLVQQTPNFALHVMKVMVDRIRRLDELLETQAPTTG